MKTDHGNYNDDGEDDDDVRIKHDDDKESVETMMRMSEGVSIAFF